MEEHHCCFSHRNHLKSIIFQIRKSFLLEYGEFDHNKNKKYYDFEGIRNEILSRTDQIAGKNKEISSDPIKLSIYSPNVLDLTLIDLPGIVRIAENEPDIQKRLENLALEFIEKENCLILAVSAGNVDLDLSDGLKLARQVDKDGLRTIGVLTMLDLDGPGIPNVLEILEGKMFPLNRPFIGVVNRSQTDIDRKKKIEEALKSEHDFFRRADKPYKDIADRLGTFYNLSSQFQHIHILTL